MAQNMQITWGQEPSLKARKSPPSNEPPAQVTARTHSEDLAGEELLQLYIGRVGECRAKTPHCYLAVLLATWISFPPVTSETCLPAACITPPGRTPTCHVPQLGNRGRSSGSTALNLPPLVWNFPAGAWGSRGVLRVKVSCL